MKIVHIALGGCLRGPPVAYGLTGDTGGHIAYVLGAAMAQGSLEVVSEVSILTRLFEGEGLDAIHTQAYEPVSKKVVIKRLTTRNRAYLEKDALADDFEAFTDAVLRHLAPPCSRPDFIHAHFADAASVARAARQRYGIPFVYTPHSLALQKGACAIDLDSRVDAERAALADADAIIVSSRDEVERQVAAYAIADVGRRLHIVPPGPPCGSPDDGTRMGAWLQSSLDEPSRPMVLAVARPVRRKNLIALAEAFAGSHELRARANLVILAGQPDRKRCSAEVAAVLAAITAVLDDPRLAGIAVRAGHHTHAEVQALYEQAAATRGVFVNPASHEPFGLTLLEAAVAGLPVVATRNGGPADIVEAIGHGTLVDPNDRGAIAEACLRIIGDADLHRALSGAALRNHHRFSWPRYAERSVALYARILREPLETPAPRLVICDIDNTLTGCAAAAARFAAWSRRRRVGFIVATGRSLEEAQAVLAHWQLPEPDAFITSVGTMIHRRISDGGLERWSAFETQLDEDWDRSGVAGIVDRLGLVPQDATNQGSHKLSYFGTATDAFKARRAIAAAGLVARVVHSHERYLDILAPNAGKGAAVKAYASDRGLTLADCIAAGDSGNDADMLEVCGIAIVVGNASNELAGLTKRPGLIRAQAHHADGVLEGLMMAGLVPDANTDLAA